MTAEGRFKRDWNKFTAADTVAKATQMSNEVSHCIQIIVSNSQITSLISSHVESILNASLTMLVTFTCYFPWCPADTGDFSLYSFTFIFKTTNALTSAFIIENISYFPHGAWVKVVMDIVPAFEPSDGKQLENVVNYFMKLPAVGFFLPSSLTEKRTHENQFQKVSSSPSPMHDFYTPLLVHYSAKGFLFLMQYR